MCPEETTQAIPVASSQATVTVAPVFSNAGSVSDIGPSGAPDSYVVNPRTPSVLPASRRSYRKLPLNGRFNARRGREEDTAEALAQLFSFSDANGISSKHHFNLNNQYYQGFHNHRVKRHEKEMKKSNLGEVNTNGTLKVYLYNSKII